MTANPETSINAACHEVNDTLTSYQLFNNDSVIRAVEMPTDPQLIWTDLLRMADYATA